MLYTYSIQLTILSFLKNRWLLLCLLCGNTFTVQAQGQVYIRGTVVNPAGDAIEFATVTLHRATDSVVVKTEFSDGKGRFQLEGMAGKRYLLSVAQVSFGRYWTPVFEPSVTGVALPVVQLAALQTANLQEVLVKGRKPPYEHYPDRTVVNVADSPLSAGATTLDVLSRSPGVTADASDNLSLRGRQGVLIVIDGKRVPLTGNELADYLRALPANQVQSLELITSPPASYDAQGGAGVIAINLKKDQRLGTNGSANGSYGRGEFGKFTGGLSVNHRRKNLNVYGNYTYTDRQGFSRLDFQRHFLATPQLLAGSSVLYNDQLSHLRSHIGKVGLDLNLSKRTLIGASVSGLASRNLTQTQSNAQFVEDVTQQTTYYTSTAAQDIKRPNGSANLNLRHAFADSASAASLTLDADYARYNTTRLLDLYTYYNAPIRPNNLLSGDQRNNLAIGVLKADFSQPLPYRTRLEAGAKVTRVTTTNDVALTNTVDGATIVDQRISSQFQYRENVNAAYVNLLSTWAGTTLQAGLRAEQTNTHAEMADSTAREWHYTKLFPNLMIQRKLGKAHTWTLLVTRRIDRPAYGQINPLRAYFDATSYQAGNPDLVAATSYNFELNYAYKQKFSAALAYARTDQPIVNVVQPSPDGGRVVVNRNVNLATQHFYTLTLTVPLEPTKWWTVYANGLFYYNRYVGTLAGTSLDRGGFATNLTLNNSFMLPGNWVAEINGIYESHEVFQFQVIQPRGQVTVGVQKSLLGKQASLRLNVSDVFYTVPTRVTSTYDNFTETYFRRDDTRVVTASLTYRFGNGKVAAARKRVAGGDEELRRAASQ